MKTLHIVPDEKFIDGVIDSFAAIGEEARFLMLVNETRQLSFIRQKDTIEQIVIGSEQYHSLTRSNWPDLIWIHYLEGNGASFISDYAGKAKIVWSAWGGDYHALLHKPILSPRTMRALLMRNIRTMGYRQAFRRALGAMRQSAFYYLGDVKRTLPKNMSIALRKVSFFSTVIPEEEPLIRKLLGQTPIKISFSYLSPHNCKSPFVCRQSPHNEEGINVWVGNSAHLSNNTIDVIHHLAKADGVDKVYAPLSYGDKSSAALIDQYGQQTFGNRWNPIFQFMDLDAYLLTMSSCSAFVFGHIRQQGVGNVSAALLAGGCVFMHPRSPLYAHLRNIGFRVYRLRELSRLQAALEDFAPYRESNIAIAKQRYEQMDPVKTLRETIQKLALCMDLGGGASREQHAAKETGQ